MIDHLNTIIIGGGQAGLATSYCLKQRGHEHVIFDKAPRAASAWRKRWDSFTLVTPNWMVQLPGAKYQGDNPDGFMIREEIVAFFEAYIERFNLPIHYGVNVRSVEPSDSGYLVSTNTGDYLANNVVVAHGFYQHPFQPNFSTNCPGFINQIHSSQYMNPEVLPEGAVLVVGSAQSGSQIAEELNEEGRQVYLSVGTTGRFPRRYRGKDAYTWMEKLGYFNRTVDQLPPSQSKYAASAHGTGKNGGHTINLHQFARDGIVLLGHLEHIEGNHAYLAPDLKDNLAIADQFENEFVQEIDQYIQDTGIDCPQETLPILEDGFKADEIRELDLLNAGIRTIIWATGYQSDFKMIKCPVFDHKGLPQHNRGITEWPGLYFIGMPFLHSGKSGLLYGTGEDAGHIASAITARERVISYTR